jgi:hypothetical protein
LTDVRFAGITSNSVPCKLDHVGTIDIHGEHCSLPEIIEMKMTFLPSGEGNGSKFWAWVICTGMEIALSAAAPACSHVSDIVRRTEKKVGGKRED